jgi:DNA polymerase III subunit gamma/tau
MSYTVLARKYRPQTFADLVGQEHVTRTLANAIVTGRVAHAFLFTGVRGVGKTTSARILAKALNCERGPTPEPCNECDICKQITSGVDLDVLEIDGASNNGVDDVRRLQESLPYRPTRDRFKIVIVDEVHMLSSGAFNAFLKTLEEPPAHVKFIFATTESHKVPVTIRSRCQRYDFRMIPQAVIAARVSQILSIENIEADSDAIAIVAREAAGSMRDAVTLLDQIIAFSGEKLNGREVAEKLGIADRAQLLRLAECVLTGDAKGALEQIDAIATRGLDLTHLTRQWLELLRDMTVLRVADDKPELVELPEEERGRALALANSHPLLELERVFAGVAKLVEEVSKSSTPRLLLEMGALRLATRPPLTDLSELISRLERLDAGGGGQQGARPATPPQRGGPSGGVEPGRGEPPRRSESPVRTAHAERAPSRDAGDSKPNPFQRFVPPESRAGEPESRASEPPRTVPPMPSHGLTAAVPPSGPNTPHGSSMQPAVAMARDLAAGPALSSAAVLSPVRAVEPVASEPSRVVSVGTHAAEARSPEQRAGSTMRGPATPVEAAPRPALAPNAAPSGGVGAHGRAAAPNPSNQVTTGPTAPSAPPRAVKPLPTAEWFAVIQALRAGEPRWSAMFEHGVPLELNTARVVVAFQEGSFFGRQAQSQGGLEALRRAAERALGATPAVEVRFALDLPGMTVAQHDASQVDERKESIRRKALSHPRVVEALKVFPELGQKHDVQVD